MGKDRWGRGVGSITYTDKVIIPEGQDNDHLLGEKKKQNKTKT